MQPPFVQLLEEQVERHDLGDRGGMAQLILVLRVKYAAGIAVDHDFSETRTSALRRVFMMSAMENDAEMCVARKVSKMPEVLAVVGFGRTAERREKRGHETCQDQR